MRKKQNIRQDAFFNKAKREGYPARSIYKLKEIDQKYKLIKPGNIVLDLGCAPGSWMMYISEKVGHKGKVFGVDIQDMKIKFKENMKFIKGDAKETIKGIKILIFDGRVKIKKFDIVFSDMAPKTTGIKIADVVRSLELAEDAFKITKKTLKIKGHFVVKIFESEDTKEFTENIRKNFTEVRRIKPQAVMKQSREFYILARGFHE